MLMTALIGLRTFLVLRELLNTTSSAVQLTIYPLTIAIEFVKADSKRSIQTLTCCIRVHAPLPLAALTLRGSQSTATGRQLTIVCSFLQTVAQPKSNKGHETDRQKFRMHFLLFVFSTLVSRSLVFCQQAPLCFIHCEKRLFCCFILTLSSFRFFFVCASRRAVLPLQSSTDSVNNSNHSGSRNLPSD
ncbi:hypothetical protein J3F84DRAFT_340321 [Trichoderma pleuroticola]